MLDHPGGKHAPFSSIPFSSIMIMDGARVKPFAPPERAPGLQTTLMLDCWAEAESAKQARTERISAYFARQ